MVTERGTCYPSSPVSFLVRLLAVIVVAIVLASTAHAGITPRVLSARDAIQTARFLQDPMVIEPDGRPRARTADGPIFAPDGQRYVLLLVRGDIERDGVTLDVFAGTTPATLDTALPPGRVASLFMIGGGRQFGYGAGSVALAGFNRVQWLGNNSIALMWGDRNDVSQVFAVYLDQRRVQQLTSSDTDVVDFRSIPNGPVLYFARRRFDERPSRRLRDMGFAVPENAQLLPLLAGWADGTDTLDLSLETEFFIVSHHGQGEPVALLAPAPTCWPALFHPSPNGEYVLMNAQRLNPPVEWERYDDPLISLFVREARHDRRRCASALSQVMVVDLQQRTSRPLLDAPMSYLLRTAWSPNGETLILGPTFLPPDVGGTLGNQGKAYIELDVATGAITLIPTPESFLANDADSIRWIDETRVEIATASGNRMQFHKQGRSWSRVTETVKHGATKPRIGPRLVSRQSANSPPLLVAVEVGSRNERELFDPNAGLMTNFALGYVERIRWRDASGQGWTGRLHHPTRVVSGRQYPLVIQASHSPRDDEFSLYGTALSSLGPGPSVYLAQVLAGQDMFVLNVDEQFVEGASLTAMEAALYANAFEAAVNQLQLTYAIDRDRVGLTGFSRTGWYVEYALTHTSFQYAAAMASDNADAGYFSATAVSYPLQVLEMVGPAPFGVGMSAWLARSPPFNADRVRTPLRLQLESGGLAGLVGPWEMYTRLRHLDAPVELFVVGDIEHGSHGLQRPSQLLVLQQGAVDWYNFWLNRRERSELLAGTLETKEDLAAQYRRWHALRDAQTQTLARPRPPLLEWSSATRLN